MYIVIRHCLCECVWVRVHGEDHTILKSLDLVVEWSSVWCARLISVIASDLTTWVLIIAWASLVRLMLG